VSVPTAELIHPTVSARRGTFERLRTAAAPLGDARFYVILAVVGLVIGGFSLLIPSTPSYDPWAWLVWGREIIHLDLHTTGGPTWKPLPMIFTTVFALFGKAAPDMWLVVARAGAVMAAVMVFKMAMRLTWWLGGVAAGDRSGASRGERIAALAPGLLAGLIAMLGLVFSGAFITDNAYGYSEGLMTALVLIAVERHLEGHQRQAFTVAFFAALDRPEIWVFWGPYGLWLFWKDPGARRLVIALFVLIPVLWFLPEYWGSGHFFRGVTRANHPRSNSPAFARCPFCQEFRNAWVTVLTRIKIAALVGLAAAVLLLALAQRKRRDWKLADNRERAMFYVGAAAVAGLAWWTLVAILTQAGFSGNNRYLVLGAALIEVAGGAAYGWAAIEFGKVRRRMVERTAGEAAAQRNPVLAGVGPAVLLVAAVFAFIPGFVGNSMTDIQRTHRSLIYQAHLREDLNAIIAKFGGAKRILACGSVMTEGFQVPMVAYALGVRTLDVQEEPQAPKTDPTQEDFPGPGPRTILQLRAQSNASLLPYPDTILHWEQLGTRYPTFLHVRTFRLLSTCPARVA
jgi:hypothetical protein